MNYDRFARVYRRGSRHGRFTTLEIVGAIGVGLSAAAIGLAATLWQRHKLRGNAPDRTAPPAFADKETPAANFDQTRSAGPDAMRDAPDDWDGVDQASDESFPASDPPANY